MRTSRSIAVATTLLLVGAACGGGSEGGGGGADAGAGSARFENVTLATVGNMMHLPEYVAVERGFWAEQGLNVKLDILSSGADVNKAMESGNAQFGSASTTSVPAARAAGLPQKLVAPGMNDATSATYAGPLGIVGRADRGIKPDDPSSLIGKKVAVHEGSTNHEYLLLYLEENGIDPNEVEIVPIEAQDQPVSFEQGDVDAASDWEPFVTQMAMEQGDNAVLLSMNDPLLGYTIGVGATDEVIEDEADIMEKFSKGIAQASYWIRQNPEEAAEVATNFISGLKTEYAVAAMDNLSFDPRISACTEESFEIAGKGLAEKGEIDSAPPGPEMMDATIMEKVEEENPEWFEGLPPIPPECK